MTAQLTPSLSAVLAGPAPVRVDRSWWSWAGPHGGLLAALALRAASGLAGPGRTPRALTVQLLQAPDDALLPSADLIREGGASSTVSSALRGADGTPAVNAVLTSGRSGGGGTPYTAVPAPDVPGPDGCAPVDLPVDVVPYTQHLELRPAAGTLPFAGGSVAEMVAWVRLIDDDPLDTAALTVLADSMPPALYAIATTPVAVPTVELSMSYASGLDAAPRRGWVLVRIATRTAADGWCVDDSNVWAPDGELLVSSRQTRRVLGEVTR